MTDLVLPFPTFQYRGKILRADDREGAHAYLFKSDKWHLEFSGTGYPALSSDKNADREEMPDIPWILGLGPQLVWKFASDWEFSLSAYEAIATDFQMTRFQGQIYQSRLSYEWDAGPHSNGHLFLTLKSGSQDFLSIFYDVTAAQSRPTRPAYESKAGFLSDELAYFQSIKSGRVAYYAGLAWTDYHLSANRQSPLHKRDSNVSVFFGITYVLGESSKPEVPLDETRGLINRK